MKKTVLQLLLMLLFFDAFSQKTIIRYLSGTDKDHTVNWDFYCSEGRRSGEWTKIAVPSNWEQQGFGNYNYGHDKVKFNEQGRYKQEFHSENWKGKRVFIVFEGSMTDTKVLVNGKMAGPIHQGSFYRFKYDITKLIKPNGQNLLQLTVDKTSANASVNNAERKGDFWVFGGIFRPVYLEILPEAHIGQTIVNAKADGSFHMDVYTENLKGGEIVEVQVQELNGQNIGKPLIAQTNKAKTLEVNGRFVKPKLWSAEFPNLYQAVITLKNKQGITHQLTQKFGFRTVELRLNDGLYVNNVRIILKGSNRHSLWPETGRTLSHSVQLMDVKLMKEMNMNAVRMSHYPPDVDFLNVCDSLGLYVIDELTGWQANYDDTVGHKLVKELVLRDVNHPAIVFWANGNEGGFNTALDNDYGLYDSQKRTVIHPWTKFNGTDTKHYPDYNYMVNAASNGKEVFFPTEFMHGLYDGGAGAALDDFWNMIMKHPHGTGGFIWAFSDEAIIRTDKNGIYDSDGNHGPDGIVGPHREKEASFYTIKEIWSPIFIPPFAMDASFNGKIILENRYSFTNLNQCTFKWKLVDFPSANDQSTRAMVKTTGISSITNLIPGAKGQISLKLPSSWSKNDALFLTAFGPDQKEIYTWSWNISNPEKVAGKISAVAKSPITIEDTGATLIVKADGIRYHFDTKTGYIQEVQKPTATISLSGGPVLAGLKTGLKHFNPQKTKDGYVVEADYQGEGSLHVKWIFRSGGPVRLEYQYSQTGNNKYNGITFNYPEEKITGMKWLGKGPYRVWKNRLKGQQIGVWQKDYNNSITGETWGYPEFKGYHAAINWVKVENKESAFTIYTTDKDIYLQMLKPDREKAALQNNNVEPDFPAGSIGFLHGISPIGTKFQSADVMGPQSQLNVNDGNSIAGVLLFDFSH